MSWISRPKSKTCNSESFSKVNGMSRSTRVASTVCSIAAQCLGFRVGFLRLMITGSWKTKHSQRHHPFYLKNSPRLLVSIWAHKELERTPMTLLQQRKICTNCKLMTCIEPIRKVRLQGNQLSQNLKRHWYPQFSPQQETGPENLLTKERCLRLPFKLVRRCC